jgi:putative MATE family efflux protein
LSSPVPSRVQFDRSIVEGPLGRAVWKLAWPTILQNIFGGLQGLIDHAMVGHYVGYVGNAAIGVSWQIFLVVVVFIASLYTGMGVLVARFSGAGDAEKVDRAVQQALLVSVALAAFVLAPIGYFVSPALLGLVNAAPDVQAEALPYLRILFIFGIGMLLFYLLSGALRAAGDARTPLRLGVMLTALNIALNVILIRGLGPIPAFGTTGAAMGTVIAGAVVTLAGLRLLFSHRLVIRFSRGDVWWPDWGIIRALFRFGLPAGFQGVVMNIAGVLLLRFVGSLRHSAEAQAAYAVGYTELFSLITWTSVGLMGAAAAVAGQNLGAGRPDRSAHAVHIAAYIGLGMAAILAALFVSVPETLLAFFGMTEPEVVALGVGLLRYLSVSAFFITVALTYTGGLQGTGDTRGPLYISIVSQVVIPIGLLSVLQATTGLEPEAIWLAIVLGHFTRCTLTVLRFRQGRWKDIAIDMGSGSR